MRDRLPDDDWEMRDRLPEGDDGGPRALAFAVLEPIPSEDNRRDQEAVERDEQRPEFFDENFGIEELQSLEYARPEVWDPTRLPVGVLGARLLGPKREALLYYNALLGEIPVEALRRAITWPFARLHLSDWQARVEWSVLRIAYFIYISFRQVAHPSPTVFPLRGCTSCGKPTGNWCDKCDIVTRSLCMQCELWAGGCKVCCPAWNSSVCKTRPASAPWDRQRFY